MRFLTGSETGFAVTPVGEWHARELEMFVQYMGMSPMEAIVAAHPQRRVRHAHGG